MGAKKIKYDEKLENSNVKIIAYEKSGEYIIYQKPLNYGHRKGIDFSGYVKPYYKMIIDFLNLNIKDYSKIEIIY